MRHDALFQPLLSLTDMGVSNFYIGSKSQAEQCFAQALSCVDPELCRAPSTVQVSTPHQRFQMNIGTNGTADRAVPQNAQEKKEVQKFDEGMDVFVLPLHFNEMASPDHIASVLLYNIGLLYAQSDEHAMLIVSVVDRNSGKPVYRLSASRKRSEQEESEVVLNQHFVEMLESLPVGDDAGGNRS